MYTFFCSIIGWIIGWFLVNEYVFGVVLIGFIFGIFIDILRHTEDYRTKKTNRCSIIDVTSDFFD